MLPSQDRLAIIAQLCHDRDVNPSKGQYANFVRGICCGQMFLSTQTAVQVTKTLTTAYYHDRWQSLLKEINGGLSPVCGSTFTSLQIPQTEALEKTHTVKAYSPKQTAKILLGKAKHDTYNGVGRLTEYEAKDSNTTLEEAYRLLTEFCPQYDIEQRGNCLLIFWDGKETVRSIRDLNRIIQPVEKNVGNPEADVVDDTYDEAAPTVKDGES